MILCSGAFDGLHAGHIGYLREAHALRERGEQVVVLVAPDDYILRIKGRRPIWSQGARYHAVKAYADEVALHHPSGIALDVEFFRPRILVKGNDWQGHLPPEILAACQTVGTAIAYVDSGSSLHTSEIVRA
jgi:cytidyltransferase-like protein